MDEIAHKLNLDSRSCVLIHQDKELCQRILNEYPIRLSDFVEKYNISKEITTKYIKSGLLSSFRNLPAKGSPIFIFENEAVDLFGKLIYSPNAISVTAIMNRTLESYLRLIEKVCRKTEFEIIYGILSSRETFKSLSKKHDLSVTRIIEIYNKTIQKTERYLKSIPRYESLLQALVNLRQEHKDIIISIKNLYEKYPDTVSDVYALNKAYTVKVSSLNFSVRTLNCLKAADIETLGDLLQYDTTSLLKFRNFGKKSLAEIHKVLDEYNLNLKY